MLKKFLQFFRKIIKGPRKSVLVSVFLILDFQLPFKCLIDDNACLRYWVCQNEPRYSLLDSKTKN